MVKLVVGTQGDIYEQTNVDQSFSNYLIKHAFVDKKVLPLNQIIETSFYLNKRQTINACNTLLSVFSDKQVEEYIEQQISLVWDRLVDDKEKFLPFFNAFHLIRPTETLILLKARIDSVPASQFNVREIEYKKENRSGGILDDTIRALCSFKLHPQLLDAVELLFEYYHKQPELFSQVFYAFVSEFGVNKDSPRYGYYTQKTVVNCFCSLLESSSDENDLLLFIRVAEEYLKMKYTITEGGRRNTVTLYSMTLPPEVPVFEYRNQLLKQLFSIYERGFGQNEIEKLLLEYCSRTNGEIEREIVSHELDTILLFFKLFSPGNLCHCIIAGKIKWVAEFVNYDCGDILIPYLESQKYKILFYAHLKYAF